MQNIENFGKFLLLILLMPCKMSLHCTEMAYIHYINDESHSRTALLKTNANNIPVGCAPSTAVAICRQGVSAGRGVSALGGICPGDICPGGWAFTQGVSAKGGDFISY